MNCAFCKHHNCYVKEQNCTRYSKEEAAALYTEQDVKIMQAAAVTEAENYLKMTRLEESLFFLQQMGIKKIGIAFCIGLANEAKFCAQYFKNAGIEVESVCCKNCSIDKDIWELQKIKPGKHEAMCNPKMQAQLMNDAKTEANFIVGLCVGHDMIFTKHSEAPVSSLITKDRVLANNPAGVVYSRYWRRKLGILEEGTV